MHNIDTTIQTETGQKAVGVTKSKKILDVISMYEKTGKTVDKETKPSADTIKEEDEDEEDKDNGSSYTPSPAGNNIVKQAALVNQRLQDDKGAASLAQESSKSLSPKEQANPYAHLAGQEKSSMAQKKPQSKI